MKSEEVDSAVKLIRKLIHHEVPWEIAAADKALDDLATALKSALADSERIDWINENCVLYIPGAEPDGHDQVCWNEDQGRTLRQAIDERRKT